LSFLSIDYHVDATICHEVQDPFNEAFVNAQLPDLIRQTVPSDTRESGLRIHTESAGDLLSCPCLLDIGNQHSDCIDGTPTTMATILAVMEASELAMIGYHRSDHLGNLAEAVKQ
jgi:hypothetical protein